MDKYECPCGYIYEKEMLRLVSKRGPLSQIFQMTGSARNVELKKRISGRPEMF
jgi:hypothetical protein